VDEIRSGRSARSFLFSEWDQATRSTNVTLSTLTRDQTTLKHHHRAAPHLALVAVQIFFATWPIVGKLALGTLPSVALVGFRVAGATVVLVMLAQMTGNLSTIAAKDWPLLIVSSALGLVFNQWLFVKGLSLTTAINATLLSTSIPVSTLLVGMFLGTDRVTWRRMLGIGLAATGVMYLIGPARSEFAHATRIGDLLIVANSLCYGAYIAVSKDLLSRYSALTVITWIFIIGSVATIVPGVISLTQIDLRSVPLKVWVEVAYIILIPTAITYYLNAWALARVPPSTVAVYIYLQPLIAFVAAPIILGEASGLRAIISTLLIFAGVFLVTRRSRSKQPAEAEILERAL
jgi:drug/metabolite transporter (DMT)-like permease